MTESTTNLKILLIVGNGIDSELLSFEFSARGFQVIVPTAHQLAAEETLLQIPDIVFIDIELPDGAGLEIASRLRRAPGMESSWLVALGGGHDPAAQRLIRQSGFIFRFPKNIGFEHLCCLAEGKARLMQKFSDVGNS